MQTQTLDHKLQFVQVAKSSKAMMTFSATSEKLRHELCQKLRQAVSQNDNYHNKVFELNNDHQQQWIWNFLLYWLKKIKNKMEVYFLIAALTC